jgi:STE24 endopeptidase
MTARIGSVFVGVCMVSLLAVGLPGAARAQEAAPPRIAPVDDAWRSALPREADAATRAYLERLSPQAVEQSRAYFEGGYWLQLWNYLAGIAIAALLLARRHSDRMRERAQRIGRKAFFRDALFGAYFAVASFVLGLPLVIYQGYFREHQYGLATQTFVPWFTEQLVALAVNVIVSAVAVAILYAAIRRTGRNWWAWGAGISTVLLVVLIVVAPVWIDPLFNTYRPVSNEEVRSAVLAMAKADGVPAADVYEFDASRQTTRVSANVAGLLGSASVRLNDNLLRCSLPEIRAVMGHELGHFVMNHVYKMVLEFSLVILFGFLLSRWAMDRLLARYGERLGLGGVGDVASLPMFLAVFSTYLMLATPLTNTLIRTQEVEADRFGLNLSREPHGFAEAQLKLAAYRKPDPGALEEFVFYDHPSIRNRIHDAMQWREAMGVR